MFNPKPATKCRVRSLLTINSPPTIDRKGHFLWVLFQRGISTAHVCVDYSNIFMGILLGLKSRALKGGSLTKIKKKKKGAEHVISAQHSDALRGEDPHSHSPRGTRVCTTAQPLSPKYTQTYTLKCSTAILGKHRGWKSFKKKNLMPRSDCCEKIPPKSLYRVIVTDTRALFSLRIHLFSPPRVATKLINT